MAEMFSGAILVRCKYNDINRIDPELQVFTTASEAMKAAREIFFSRDFHPSADDIQVWSIGGDQHRIPCITEEIMAEWGEEWQKTVAKDRQ